MRTAEDDAMKRKASLQQTVDRLAEIKRLFSKCFKPAQGWAARKARRKKAA